MIPFRNVLSLRLYQLTHRLRLNRFGQMMIEAGMPGFARFVLVRFTLRSDVNDLAHGQTYCESTPHARPGTTRLDCPTMHLHQAFREGQPNPESCLRMLVRGRLREHLEDPGHILFAETDARILYPNHRRPVLPFRDQANRAAGLRVLGGVRQ